MKRPIVAACWVSSRSRWDEMLFGAISDRELTAAEKADLIAAAD